MNSPSATKSLRVVGLESSRAAALTQEILRYGGKPLVTPALREVSPLNNPEAVDFAHRVMTGGIDVVVFQTALGVQSLWAQVQRHVPRQRFLEALSDLTTIARGPKPSTALRELGIEPTLETAEPHTWREVLAVFDRSPAVTNQTVGVQEYGQPNACLTAGLEARGARVIPLKLYRWELPEDLEELTANVKRIAAGEVDVVLFTASPQVTNLLQLAERLQLSGAVRQGLAKSVVAAIGPDTFEALGRQNIAVDVVPRHARLELLVRETLSAAPGLLAHKRPSTLAVQAVSRREEPAAAKSAAGDDPALDSPFMKACRREPQSRTPIWLMRQAGRYMQEYRDVRAKTSFLELCQDASLCAEVMVTAVRKLNVDAAIIFSDLLPILEPMGFELEFAAGEGPVIHNPVRDAADLERVRELVDARTQLDFVMETVRLTKAALPGTPVIGFAGCPFTLASYAIEGGASRNYAHTKSLMYRDSGAWHELLGRLARSVAAYLNAQIEAGAHCVQLFDSWVGCLGPDDYRQYVMPHTQAILQSLPADVPAIHFAAGNPALLPLVSQAGGQVLGIDWRVRLDDAWATVGHDRAVQGNLDPLVLLSTPELIRQRAIETLEQAGNRPGHIFNLGHGILPQTPVENVQRLVDIVHEYEHEK